MTDIKNAKVSDYASKATHRASPETSLLEISQQLEKHNIRHMPVVKDNKLKDSHGKVSLVNSTPMKK